MASGNYVVHKVVEKILEESPYHSLTICDPSCDYSKSVSKSVNCRQQRTAKRNADQSKIRDYTSADIRLAILWGHTCF